MLTQAIEYYLIDYVSSTNSPEPLNYSFPEQTEYYTFYYGAYNGDGYVGHIVPKANGGPFRYYNKSNAANGYLAPDPVKLYVTVSL